MQRVLTRRSYLFLALGVALVVFFAAVWLPNARLVSLFFFDPSLSFAFALRLTWDLLLSSLQNIQPLFFLYTALAALLIGINAALLVWYIRLYQFAPSVRNVASGIAGAFLALIGFGCVSCGSIFFTALLTAASGTGLLILIPYLGVGVGILGLVLLVISAIFLSRAINTPTTSL